MNIYVGNLDWDTTEAEVRTAFEAYGAVSSVSIIKDRQTDTSRGFGFVEMASAVEAQAAISALNGRDLNGRSLTVNQAKERDERPRGQAQRNTYRPARSPGGRDRRHRTDR